MYAKKNGRVSFRSNKRSHYKKNTNPYLNNKLRSKGNISQLFEKYSKLAKEASSSGDRIQSEYYYQFADHYSRLMIEFGLKSFNNENSSDNNENSSESVGEKIFQNEEQVYKSKEKNISLNENEKNKSENSLENNSDSIGEVSFIAKPAKKTSSKVKKEVS